MAEEGRLGGKERGQRSTRRRVKEKGVVRKADVGRHEGGKR